MRWLFLVCITACGRLGFDPTLGSDDAETVPPACAVTALGLGGRHTCATVRGGQTYCVGDNALAQLGTGTASSAVTTPVLASALPPALDVKGGRAFTCVRDAAGAVACLGDNGNHNCDGVTTGISSPVALIPAVPPVTMMALGNSFVCAAGATEVWCWGDNDEAEGGNNTSSSTHPPEPVALMASVTTASVAAGNNHVCVVIEGGVVRCWGDGRTLRLGSIVTDTCPMATDGSHECALLPVTVSIPAARSIWAGKGHTCAILLDGDLWCWGENDQGQLGRPPSVQELPAPVSGISQLSSVAAARNHTCALDTAGDVWCWGDNSLGQLGSAIGDSSQPVLVPLAASATKIATHSIGFATCALLVDDTVWCWGANDVGQLGRGTLSVSEPPGPLVLPCP